MDSGNSGSMQSSSGGDDEYDSRAESISPFLNSSSHFGPISIPNTQPPSLPHHPPTFFHPSSSHNIDSFSHSPPNPNPNPLFNLDLAWSGSIRSDTNYADYGTLSALSTPSSLIGGPQAPFQNSSVPGNGPRAPPPAEQTPVVKNPKKRTRASRRAPTTVLTTDTANFRQMVQEFTGIPAAPFSSSPYSRRLDLFSTGSSMRSGHNLDTLGQLYPLRPSAQKAHPQPPAYVTSSSSHSFMVDSIAANMASNTNTSIVGNSNNYQPTQPQNMLNMQNPILNIQSLMQSQGGSRIPSLADLGMSNLPRWRDGGALNDGGQENLGSLGGNNGNMQNVGNYKLQTSSASASDFHHEKGLENVSSKGEGTTDTWICPSD